MKKLAVIIINYKTPQLTLDCLNSLASEINPKEHQVVVVDNASGDQSLPILQKAIAENHWQGWVKVLASPVNGGFSAGNNLGIKAVKAQAYWLLNSDTIVRPGALQILLNTLENHPKAGLVSPQLEWPDGTPQISCFRFHTPASEAIAAAGTGLVTKLLEHHNLPLPIQDDLSYPQWTSFASVIIRSEVFTQIGLMDEDYFLYYEDVDFCRRAYEAGWQIINNPEAKVVHLRGGSSSTKQDVATRQRPPAYLYQSRSRYFAKFYGPSGLGLANGCWFMGRAVAYAREIVGNKTPHACLKQEQDIWFNWVDPLKTRSPSPSNSPKLNYKGDSSG